MFSIYSKAQFFTRINLKFTHMKYYRLVLASQQLTLTTKRAVPAEFQLMNNFVNQQSKHRRPSSECIGGSNTVIHGFPSVAVATVFIDERPLGAKYTG